MKSKTDWIWIDWMAALIHVNLFISGFHFEARNQKVNVAGVINNQTKSESIEWINEIDEWISSQSKERIVAGLVTGWIKA